MKSMRQSSILDIILNQDIETQEELVSALEQRGFSVTQATISRDIKQLRLTKVLTGNGRAKYATLQEANQDASVSERISRVFADTVMSIRHANNLIVIHTINGAANAAAAAVDSLQWDEILGTVAGDDTILVVVSSNQAVSRILDKFNSMVHR